MRDKLMAIHYWIVGIMAKSWIVENLLIVKVREIENGEEIVYDCIYCTILRNAVLFMLIGLIVGYFAGCRGL